MADFEDFLEDDDILERMRQMQERQQLREQSMASGNPLGRAIAGLAGGIEAGMTGKSGAEAAIRGMQFVDERAQKLAALQGQRDNQEMGHLVRLAQMRARAKEREAEKKAALEKAYLDADLRLRNEKELLPLKEQSRISGILQMAQAQGANSQELAKLNASLRSGQMAQEQQFKRQESAEERAFKEAQAEKDRAAKAAALQTQEAGRTTRASLKPAGGGRGGAKAGKTGLEALTGDAKMKVGLIVEGLTAGRTAEGLIAKGATPSYINQSTPLIGQFVSSEPIDEQVANMSDIVGRMRSGGAINKDEEGRFLRMLPRPADSPEAAKRKLQQFREGMEQKLKVFGVRPEELSAAGISSAETGFGMEGDQANLRDLEHRSLPKERVVNGVKFILQPNGKYRKAP